MKYRKGYKYQLAETVHIETPFSILKRIETEFITYECDGRLIGKSGYAWDGATSIPDTRWNFLAALGHDMRFQLHRMELLPQSKVEESNELYRLLCIDAKMWEWFARLEFEVLQRVAGQYADPKNAKIVYDFPPLPFHY